MFKLILLLLHILVNAVSIDACAATGKQRQIAVPAKRTTSKTTTTTLIPSTTTTTLIPSTTTTTLILPPTTTSSSTTTTTSTTSTSTTTTTCGPFTCLAGFSYFATTNQCYQVVTIVINAVNAEIQCQNNGASFHLASVHSQTEMDFITSLIDAQAPPSSSANDGYILGMSLAQGHTQMNPGASWMDGTPFDYANFVFNEPANSGGNDNCASTYASTNTFFGGVFAGKWNDIDCTTDIMGGFVCEESATQTCA